MDLWICFGLVFVVRQIIQNGAQFFLGKKKEEDKQVEQKYIESVWYNCNRYHTKKNVLNYK